MQTIGVYVPPFASHHSKVFVLFFNDGAAQIIVHTANIVPVEWENVTQMVWRSPLLRALSHSSADTEGGQSLPVFGSGQRFKNDFLAYLGAYPAPVPSMVARLTKLDFSKIKAAFVYSLPSEITVPATQTSDNHNGWKGLDQVLRSIPRSSSTRPVDAHIVIQVSSVAFLGVNQIWLDMFKSVLCQTPRPINGVIPSRNTRTRLSLVYPSSWEKNRFLDSAATGQLLFFRTKATHQQRQFTYLAPMLSLWATLHLRLEPQFAPSMLARVQRPLRDSHRSNIAPHCKTYIKFEDRSQTSIEWAVLTSSNLSKQAWGTPPNRRGVSQVKNWEAGIVVWPSLFADRDGQEVTMVPTFGADTPASVDLPVGPIPTNGVKRKTKDLRSVAVGLRMPYSLPLSPYGAEDRPWSAL